MLFFERNLSTSSGIFLGITKWSPFWNPPISFKRGFKLSL